MHDAHELTEHLQLSCAMIRRHRSRMISGGIGYSDNPTFGGFGPKSPCNESAMEMGDMEAAFVGNLARYCMALGTIPPHSLRGLWWVNGECKGISTYNEDSATLPIQGLINHLAYWSPYIIGTEGVDELLRAGEETRWYSKKMFPNENTEWVGIEEAEKITGRARKTIQDWRREGWIETLDDNWGVMYSRAGLETIKEMNQAAKASALDRARKNRW